MMLEPRVNVSLHRTELNSLIWLVQDHINRYQLYNPRINTEFEDILRSLTQAKVEFNDELDKELQKIADEVINNPNSGIMVFDTLGNLNI